MYIKKEQTIKRVNLVGDKVNATMEIAGVWVSNPTLEQIMADGWEEYTPPQPPAPQPYVPTYEELVLKNIRERYTVDDELAILRQRDVKPDEFAEYNNFCEQCKSEARSEVEKFM